jgi:23S rRNA pseudouridine2457 synthase
MLIAFNKPYGTLSQFTPDGSKHKPLADFHFPKNVYALGRLDADSEGLLLLTDEKNLNQKLLRPEHEHPRIYWVQVEREPTTADLQTLQRGVVIDGYKTKPCKAKRLLPEPELPERVPPVRFRKTVPTAWIELDLTEGKNRQVRKMTAAIGFPTLRLVRVKIGGLALGNLKSGEWKVLNADERKLVFGLSR